jgi:hypothetical protein
MAVAVVGGGTTGAGDSPAQPCAEAPRKSKRRRGVLDIDVMAPFLDRQPTV